MPKFGLIQAQSVQDAINLMTKYGKFNARLLSGGSDIFYQMKNRIGQLRPSYLIDISGLGLSYINYSPTTGLKIGATTPISDIEKDPNIMSNFSVLSQAASEIATPEVRNTGTAAGDILQEVWCPYLRNNYDCWRNGGSVCYGAIGDNRFYHSIFGGRLCYAIHASDLGPAFLALDAGVTIAGSGGSTKTMTIDQLIPGINVIEGQVKENVLSYNELVTEIAVPALPANSKSSYYKVKERGVWDFALASAAVRATFAPDGSITDSRVVLGGVDVKPRRASAAEQYLKGKALSESTYAGAADAAVSDATPLTVGLGNDYRVDLARGAVIKALRAIGTGQSSS